MGFFLLWGAEDTSSLERLTFWTVHSWQQSTKENFAVLFQGAVCAGRVLPPLAKAATQLTVAAVAVTVTVNLIGCLFQVEEEGRGEKYSDEDNSSLHLFIFFSPLFKFCFWNRIFRWQKDMFGGKKRCRILWEEHLCNCVVKRSRCGLYVAASGPGALHWWRKEYSQGSEHHTFCRKKSL